MVWLQFDFVLCFTFSNVSYFQIITYLVLSILSTLLAIALTACYSVSLHFIDSQEGSCTGLKGGNSTFIERTYGKVTGEAQCQIRIKLAIIIIVLGISEVLAAVWSIVCCCSMFSKKSRHCYELPDEIELVSMEFYLYYLTFRFV
jgi:hypothetical protein